jgi:hypothetical protein
VAKFNVICLGGLCVGEAISFDIGVAKGTTVTGAGS